MQRPIQNLWLSRHSRLPTHGKPWHFATQAAVYPCGWALGFAQAAPSALQTGTQPRQVGLKILRTRLVCINSLQLNASDSVYALSL